MTAGGKLVRILATGASWAAVWLAFWAVVMATIGVVSPDSIDPGEPVGLLTILGSMGLLAGIALGALLVIAARTLTNVLDRAWRVVGLGALATAIVQIGYLGHGDLGLWANLKMAGLFSIVGGIVTGPWLAAARAWSRRRRPESRPV